MATVDAGAVRNTRDIDLLVRRGDLPAISAALRQAGFVPDDLLDVVMFRDGPEGKPSEAIHLLFAGEKVRATDEHPCPGLDQSERAAEFQVLALLALVQMKLTSWRLKDRVHLLDMIRVGLIDATWPARLPPPLAARLQTLLDNPDG